jgi:Fur family peroxide stress response transcriptional regulator
VINKTQDVDKLVAKLRKKHFRITPQRLALLNLLVEDYSHPSAAQIYEKLEDVFPTTSLATVYKTLGVLKDIGAIQEIGFSDGETRYDLTNPEPHLHLICTQCHNIIDAELCDAQELKQAIESAYDFKVLNWRMDYFGICTDCQNKAQM